MGMVGNNHSITRTIIKLINNVSWRPSSTEARVHPSELSDHRLPHRMLGPCCLCPLADQNGPDFTEPAIYMIIPGTLSGICCQLRTWKVWLLWWVVRPMKSNFYWHSLNEYKCSWSTSTTQGAYLLDAILVEVVQYDHHAKGFHWPRMYYRPYSWQFKYKCMHQWDDFVSGHVQTAFTSFYRIVAICNGTVLPIWGWL